MKKILLFLFLLSATTVLAQDVIVRKDGSTILSKVIEIGNTEVKYKKFSNQNGPTYAINKSDIQAINNENGEKETFDNVQALQQVPIQLGYTKHNQGHEQISPETPNKKKEQEGYSYAGLMLHNFTPEGGDFQNYAGMFGVIFPSGFGFDLVFRSEFKKYSSLNEDLLLNYNFELWSQNTNHLFFTLAAGPSVCFYHQVEGFDRNGNPDYGSDMKFRADGVINPRLTVKLGNFILTGGYIYWAPKFKFNKDDGAVGGFNIGMGYKF